MKAWFALGFFTLSLWGAGAESLTLINTLPDRPVFNVAARGVTVTRSLAPGSRIALEPGLFSGLGDKQVPLSAGTTYYLAKFGATAGLYRLAAGQVLILNQSGRAVTVTLEGTTASLASGNLALGALGANGNLGVTWSEAGAQQTKDLSAGGVYRLVLDSPEGLGTTVSLVPWE